MPEFDATIAVFGVLDANGDMLSEQDALKIFSNLSQQADAIAQLSKHDITMLGIGIEGYRITDVSIEGRNGKGRVYATFKTMRY